MKRPWFMTRPKYHYRVVCVPQRHGKLALAVRAMKAKALRRGNAEGLEVVRVALMPDGTRIEQRWRGKQWTAMFGPTRPEDTAYWLGKAV